MIFYEKLNYFLLKKEYNNLNQPRINNNPPSGVTNHIFFGFTPKIVIKYKDPEKNKIPRKKNKLILFLDFIDN